MARPTLDDARELSEWQPRLGVLSVYLRFQPGDRDQTWRAELRNELRRVREEVPEADHERQMAVIATTDRVLERLSDEKTRPPPRGEAGFVEVVEKGGAERWWATHEPPPATTAALAARPLVASLVEIAQRDEDAGAVLVSAERVRLLRFAGRSLDELEEVEITLWIRDWRERKSSSSRDPARAQGVSSSGRDQHNERLEHNRSRFLAEAGSLAARRLKEAGLARALVFGPERDAEELSRTLEAGGIRLERGGDADLISTPTGQLIETVNAAVERNARERDREAAERALGRGDGAPGARGVQETAAALEEGRVEHLVVDPTIGEAQAEELVREALVGGARVTVARDGVGEMLEPSEGVAGILRY